MNITTVQTQGRIPAWYFGTNNLIAFDADGVLFDFVGTLLRQLGDTGLTYRDIDSWDAIFTKLKPEDLKRAKSICCDPAFWRDMLVYDGMQEQIEELRKHGHAILVASSPYLSCKEWYDARRSALKEKFDITRVQAIHPSEDKAYIDAYTLIEDKLETAIAWGKWHNRNAILVDHPWNQLPEVAEAPFVRWFR